ncbi:MAG TPA: peptide chain release factor N(5)-glutamine methyltransferase [Candidatus Binatia bacterium]|nr:peptide chain release factor N(5)-glutamine methyltransferase [Candidatus Binatia bacterium]
MTTLVTLWTEVRRRLEAAGVETPVFDARLLLEAGVGVSRLDIVTDPRRPVTEEQVAAVNALVKRREAREPVGHIIGRRHFWTLDLFVNPTVLIPRPETELLVETAHQAIAPDAGARVLDFGVGSGAIVLATLADRANATGVGVDISDGALAVAQANADALGLADRLQLKHGGWDVSLGGAFDVVLSNPPYIPTNDIDELAPEVARFEPRLALDGGADGLDAYRAIIPRLPRLLRPGGLFALEVGKGQAEAVTALAQVHGLSTEPPRRDLAGIPRVVWGRHAA